MNFNIVLVPVGLLIVGIFTVILYGKYKWSEETNTIRNRLKASESAAVAKSFEPNDLLGLPPPVRRYLENVLTAGQPMIARADISLVGTFNQSEKEERWREFTSDQVVITERPGFDWNARIRMYPGVTVCVHDAYVEGEGILHASLFGAVTVASVRGTLDSAKGEFMRFVAEASWYPTRFLPNQGAIWTPIDDTSAHLEMKDGGISATFEVRFSEDNVISEIRAPSRARLVGTETTYAPWHGRFNDYRRTDGMLIPYFGEIEWIMPDGPKPYFRGHLKSIRYRYHGD